MHAPKWHMRSKCHTKYNTISMPTDIKQQEENKRHVECDGAKKPTKPTDIAFPFHVRLASKVVAWSISTRIISLRVHFFQFLFSCLFLLCRFLWCVRKRKKKNVVYIFSGSQFVRLFCVSFIFALAWKCILN